MSLCTHFPCSVLAFIWFEDAQIFGMLSQSLWVHVCISLVIFGRHCFLGDINHFLLLQSFCLFFQIHSYALKWGLWLIFLICDCVLRSPSFFELYVSSTGWRSFFYKCRAWCWSMGLEHQYESILLPWSFSRIKARGFYYTYNLYSLRLLATLSVSDMCSIS